MDLLTEAMEDRLALVTEEEPVARAQARLRECGRAYVAFALDEPGLFRTAFTSHLDGADNEGDGGPYAILNQILDELVEVGHLAVTRRPNADVVCWAGVHGFAVLHLDGPLRLAPQQEREASIVRFFDIVQRGLGGAVG